MMKKTLFFIYIIGIIFFTINHLYSALIFFIVYYFFWVFCFIFLAKKFSSSAVKKRKPEQIKNTVIILTGFTVTIVFLIIVFCFNPGHLPSYLTTAGFNCFPLNIAIYTISTIGIWLHLFSLKTLGVLFRQEPSITKNQTIIKSGPYSIMRHPIYLSYVLIFFSFFAIFNLTAGCIIGIFSFWWSYRKAKIEEKMLIEEFGYEYFKYQQETPMLFPDLKSLKRLLVCKDKKTSA